MKITKKLLLGGIIVCFGLLIGYGIYFLMTTPTSVAVPPDNVVSDQNKVKKELTAIPTPQHDADVLDAVSDAFDMNKSAVGWLRIPETDINNPVMQGDDNDYYLRRDENGEYDVYGCYFLDYECPLGKLEDFAPNTVIYGHSELTDDKDGKRFAQLYRFLDEAFAFRNKQIYLNTHYGKFTFEIISVFYTDLDFKYTRVHITDEEALELEKTALSLSEHDFSITPQLGDKLLTLSTCTAKFEDAENHRFVVMGRLIENEE